MPHHRGMVRSQCRVLETAGAGLSRHVLAVRLSPAPGRDDGLRTFLRSAGRDVAAQPGLTAAHLLRTETPAIAATTEQAIRGGRDAEADWIFLANGYDEAALQALRTGALADATLIGHGALPAVEHGVYALSCVTTPADLGAR